MPALMAMELNWKRPVLTPGRTVVIPANYGTMGRASFWHWLKSVQIPQAPAVTNPLYNALAPVNYRQGVTVVPVTLRVPVQTTPQLNFTPAGTATAAPGASGANPFAQVWTGLGGS